MISSSDIVNLVELVSIAYDDNCTEGLNVDPKGKCAFKFIKIENIKYVLPNSIYIHRVHLPVDNPKLKVKKYGDYMFKSNMVIFSEKISLLNIDTYSSLGINISNNICNIINIAAVKGDIDFIIELKGSKYKFVYNEWAINLAAANGHIKILNWWLNSGLKIKYTLWAINNAAVRGQIFVLDWWLNSGLKLKYDEWAITATSACGNLEVLDWWLAAANKHKIEFIYNQSAVTLASRHGQIEVLDWWKKTCCNGCYTFKYDKWAMNEAASYGQINVLDWWLNSGFELKYDNQAIINCCKNGHVSVLRWFVENIGLWFVKSCYTESIIDEATISNNKYIVDWWETLF